LITIDTYTAAWDAAMRPTPPRVGSYVRFHVEPDGRELDGFRRCLWDYGLVADTWVRFHPRLRMDVFRIEKDTQR